MIEYMNSSNQKHKATRGKVLDIVYTAGLIDGEGSIIISKARRNNPKYKCPHYILMVTCTNTDEDIIQWMYDNFGASKVVRKRQHDHPYWKDAYEWNISANKALVFLKLIETYIRIKKKQIKLAIHFQENKMKKRKFVTSGVVNGHTLSPETIAQREKAYQEMHFLNTGNNYRRGKTTRRD